MRNGNGKPGNVTLCELAPAGVAMVSTTGYSMGIGGEDASTTAPPPVMTSPGIIKAVNYAMTATGCTRQEAIAAVTKTMVETGISPRVALDAMFGEGTHQRLAEQVWTELQNA